MKRMKKNTYSLKKLLNNILQTKTTFVGIRKTMEKANKGKVVCLFGVFVLLCSSFFNYFFEAGSFHLVLSILELSVQTILIF